MELLETATYVTSASGGFLQNLHRTGLTKIRGITADNDGHIYYELSPLGIQFVRAYHDNKTA